MPSDPNNCKLCDIQATRKQVPMSGIQSVICQLCGEYYYFDVEVAMDADALFGNPADRRKVSALLFERKTLNLTALPPALVLNIETAQGKFRYENGEPYAYPIRLPELLATWPKTVPDQLDRAIALLAAKYPKGGELISPPRDQKILHPTSVLAEDHDQSAYIQQHLIDLKWVEKVEKYPIDDLRITPKGWQRVADWTRESNRSNPAFIARWFGKPKSHEKDQADRSGAMAELLRAIESSIEKAGFRSTKADSEDYNTGIMDKVLHDIRRAPFVVADFTNPNLGVYYEAGVAVGHGIPVIPCCPGAEFKERVHFDIAHVNFIVYDSLEDLARKLPNRILGSMGEGPYFKECGSKDA